MLTKKEIGEETEILILVYLTCFLIPNALFSTFFNNHSLSNIIFKSSYNKFEISPLEVTKEGICSILSKSPFFF